MAYITQADLVPRRLKQGELVQLTDDESQGTVNTEALDAVLAEASGIVDSYCRGRYRLPLVVSDQVKGITVDLAVHLLFLRRRRVVEDVKAAHDRAISMLRDVSKGAASLDQAAAAQTTAQEVLTVDRTEQPQTFGDDQLEAFK